MMEDLLRIQSDLNRRPKQMNVKKDKKEQANDGEFMPVVEPNPYLASARLFGPKCSTVEWLGGFRAFEFTQTSVSK